MVSDERIAHPRLFAFVVVLARSARCGRNARAQCGTREGDAGSGDRQQRTTHDILTFQLVEVVTSVMSRSSWCVVPENQEFSLVERMAAPRHPLRDRILARIRRGDIASVQEIMLIATVPRQTANRWLREAGIDLALGRMRAVARMHEQEERYLAGLPSRRRPSKRKLRAIADRAHRQWRER